MANDDKTSRGQRGLLIKQKERKDKQQERQEQEQEKTAAGVPSRDFAYSQKALRTSPGARKEKVRQRQYHRVAGVSAKQPYAELRIASAFTFLNGSSLPEDLVAQAAELELPAAALVDVGGVYGAPRFYKAARQAGIRALVGADVVIDTPSGTAQTGGNGPQGIVAEPPLPQGASPHPLRFADANPRLTLMVESRQGYRNLCRLLTAAARRGAKGEAWANWAIVKAHAGGLHCLTGGAEGWLAQRLESKGMASAQRLLEGLRSAFPGRLHVELQRHGLKAEEHRNRALRELADRLRLPVVATNGVRYARPKDKALHDVLTAIRHHTHLDAAGRILAQQRQRHLKGAAEMARLFADCPQALDHSWDLAQQLDFTLADLGYRFPDYPLPPGETPASYLRHVTWNGARARFRPLTAKAQGQIEKELALIEKLELEGYFLIVWDIVRFCMENRIMAQGRGSAANSAVCYALSITAVDPVKMGLLFERFLSEERGEWPDIDLDLPSGAPRERVIQYVYERFGPHGAAMTANVITYRDRSAARETAKALGYSTEQVDKLAKQLGRWRYDVSRGDSKDLDHELTEAGFDPREPRIRLFTQMWQQIQNLPRHLGQHSGGMIIAAGRLDEIVPLEPASMPGRTVVQWDKDDCADLGLIKVDLLGLGMLNALEEAVPLVRTREKLNLDLAHLPPDDEKTFELLRRADTVGVFQVESRAQMASLPRNNPQRFYDLVIQVAIIRPGPIVGGMVHPYFERRQGRQPVEYPHPSLEPILKRTLGIPLFQEQLLRIAMVAAGFTGGEAEELRRAMGFKRSQERMEAIERRLRSGMEKNGIRGQVQDQIVQSITSFALYGFPESHAASFALIAYASAYLKAHHPTAFLLGLLNAWPMGFYHPATLIKDAQRHGVDVRPIDVQSSDWKCRWEDRQKPAQRPAGAVRLGMRYVRNLRKETGEAIAAHQPFKNLADFSHRCSLREPELQALAQVGALASLGLTRRQALWQVARLARPAGELYALEPDRAPSPLPEMSISDEMVADYDGTGLTTGDHPLAYLRRQLSQRGVTPAAVLDRMPAGQRVKIAGSVIVRQRPGTAKGILFITVEDETGMAQAIVDREQMERHRRTIVNSPGLVIEGILQRRDGSISIKGERFWTLAEVIRIPSHDFH